MTKNEIQFLIESGFTLAEVIAMGTAQSAAPADPVEPAEPARTEPEPEPEHEATADPEEHKEETTDERFKEFNTAIESLQTELKKLGDRIAAQGVRMSGHDTAPIKTIDDTLAEIGKKLNGG